MVESIEPFGFTLLLAGVAVTVALLSNRIGARFNSSFHNSGGTAQRSGGFTRQRQKRSLRFFARENVFDDRILRCALGDSGGDHQLTHSFGALFVGLWGFLLATASTAPGPRRCAITGPSA